MLGVGGPPLLLSERQRSLNEVKNNPHLQKAEAGNTLNKLLTNRESVPLCQLVNSGSCSGSLAMPNKPKFFKRTKSTGNILRAPKIMQRAPSFSELHKITRSSDALHRLKDRHRKKPVTKEEFDVRTQGLENDLKQLWCEITVLRRCWREKTYENSRIFIRMTKYVAWVTGVHLLILRVLSFVRWESMQDVTKDLSWILVLRLIRSSKGRKQLQMYLHHVMKHQISVLTIKITPDLISLFCLSRPSQMFRIFGFQVVLFNHLNSLYQQLHYPSRYTPTMSSVLANLGANVLFVTSRWWIAAHGLPTAVHKEYARKKTSVGAGSRNGEMMRSSGSKKSERRFEEDD